VSVSYVFYISGVDVLVSGVVSDIRVGVTN